MINNKFIEFINSKFFIKSEICIEYRISTYLSKYFAYHSKKDKNGKITLYISKIYNECKDNFDKFIFAIIYFTILERICLERAFNKIKMKNKCNPYCKMENTTIKILSLLI